MTPEQLAKSGTEEAHQRAFFAWCAMARLHGDLAAFDEQSYAKDGRKYALNKYGEIHSLPILKLLRSDTAGGKRDKIAAARLKAAGAKPGFPDTHLPVACGNYHSLYIEMKSATGVLSEAQRDVFPDLIAEGNALYVCHSWIEATGKLRYYLSLAAHGRFPINLRVAPVNMLVDSNKVAEYVRTSGL